MHRGQVSGPYVAFVHGIDRIAFMERRIRYCGMVDKTLNRTRRPADNSIMIMAGKRSVFLGGVFCLCLFFGLGYRSALYGDSDLTVARDKDKTVYTIGPDKAGRGEEERKEERAWDMLDNTYIRPQERNGGQRRHDPGTRSGK